ncbi:transposase [Bradyrhizobium pachyrhizi]|uniref:IS66 family transposase n=1 Tax=Bradyrhizobium pachyrhizi TaxID=280333 RepID=UPI0024B1B123|nr:transposase [Bradyrhizobium pachyrhizi]WFU54728.1 transposase [Bradyrhizobium pachyrhizi]
MAQTQAALSEHQAALATSEEARRRLEVILGELRREKCGSKSERLRPDQYHLPLEDVELAQGILDGAGEGGGDHQGPITRWIGSGPSSQSGRSGAFAEQFLDGFNGRFLQCDAYDRHDRLLEVARPQGPWTLVHCWSHLRRRFVKLARNSKSPIAEAAVRQIAQVHCQTSGWPRARNTRCPSSRH